MPLKSRKMLPSSVKTWYTNKMGVTNNGKREKILTILVPQTNRASKHTTKGHVFPENDFGSHRESTKY